MAARPDPWASAIYAWEGTWLEWNEERLTLQQCRTVVRMACDAYGLKSPVVRQYKGHTAFSFCDPKGSYIAFVADHKNKAIAAHEAAHFIHDRSYGEHSEPDHGWHWQGIYFWLLSKLSIAPLVALKASARAHGLRWHEIGPKEIKT